MSAEFDFEHEDLAAENFRKGGASKSEDAEPQDEMTKLWMLARKVLDAGDNADKEWQEK